MTLKEDPDEEDALDGLVNAVRYCNSQGWDETAEEIASLYQEVGSLTIDTVDADTEISIEELE